jgi:hypothetical protein
MKVCIKCKQQKQKEEMIKNRNRCKICHNKQQSEWRKTSSGKTSIKQSDKKRKPLRFKIKVLKKYPCKNCGEKNINVLQFDHIDPKTKKEEISKMVKRNAPIEEIKQEMRKCQILCFNCHVKKSLEDRANI